MQVRKFEARSMKEALEMVKFHMGPEAIILSAKDNVKGFGLGGQSSVEVTAAVSEQTLRKKLLAEKKMNEDIRTKFNNSPARLQKQFIEKAFEVKKQVVKRPLTTTPYIDISNDNETVIENKNSNNFHQVDENLAEKRIKSAVQNAYSAGLSNWFEKEEPKIVKKPTIISNNNELDFLKKEVVYLRKLLSQFQKMPQTMISRHPGAEYDLPFELSYCYEKLKREGVAEEIIVEILKACKNSIDPLNLKKKAFVEAWVAKYLLEKIKIVDDLTQAKFHSFVGPSGQGKTTTLVKLASQMVIKEKKKIAIITTDCTKLGASEQLKTYAQILNVPFAIIKKRSDWNYVLEKLHFVDHFLIDFPGMNLKTIGELDFLRELLPEDSSFSKIHYVQSALAKDAEALETGARYKSIGLNDLIFTGLDEAVQHGIIYNMHVQMDLPLHSFGIGSKIPEDIEAASRERVIDLLFKLTKFRKS